VIWATMLYLQAARPWEEGGKRRIAPALLIGIIPSSLVGLDPLQGGSEPGNQPLQCFGLALAGSVAPEQVRRDLALLVPARATLAAVLTLDETGAIPLTYEQRRTRDGTGSGRSHAATACRMRRSAGFWRRCREAKPMGKRNHWTKESGGVDGIHRSGSPHDRGGMRSGKAHPLAIYAAARQDLMVRQLNSLCFIERQGQRMQRFPPT
jgi:hypothetical protein